MSRLLFIVDRVPFPVRRDGLTVRVAPLIEILGARHQLDCLILGDVGATEKQHLGELQRHCRDVRFVPPRAGTGGLARVGEWFGQGLPPRQYLVDRADDLVERLSDALNTRSYDAACCFSLDVMDIVRRRDEWLDAERLVIDVIDSPTLIFRRKADAGVRAALDRARMPAWERRLVRAADRAIYISRVDARAVAGDAAYVVPNGIYVDADLDQVRPAGHWNVGYLGNFNYSPNRVAADTLAGQVFPGVRRRKPDASLLIMGRNPTEEIARLDGDPGVTVAPDVESIWPYLRSLDLAVFPMSTGGGVQNKVLEAMAADVAVVTSPIGNEGIDAPPDAIMVCSTPDEYVEQIVRLLDDPARRMALARRGREFVTRHFAWPSVARQFEQVLLDEQPARSLPAGF